MMRVLTGGTLMDGTGATPVALISAVLKASPYQRTDDRQGYANGFEPRTLHTRLGALTDEPLFQEYVNRLWRHIREEAGGDDLGHAAGTP